MENQPDNNPYDLPEESVPDRYKRTMAMDKQQVRTLDKKHLFLVAYKKNLWSITRACDSAGIKSRKTFYNWCNTDPEFKKALDSTEEIRRDIIYDIIMMKIIKNHGPTIRWYLSKHHPDYKKKGRGSTIIYGPNVPFNPFKKYEGYAGGP